MKRRARYRDLTEYNMAASWSTDYATRNHMRKAWIVEACDDGGRPCVTRWYITERKAQRARRWLGQIGVTSVIIKTAPVFVPVTWRSRTRAAWGEFRWWLHLTTRRKP